MILKLGFLASNNGSVMRAIVDAIADQRLQAEARLLVYRGPHLHAILAVRFQDDIAPGEPLPNSSKSPFPPANVARDADALRKLLADEYKTAIQGDR